MTTVERSTVIGEFAFESFQDGIIAHSGGGQAGAVQLLPREIYRVVTATATVAPYDSIMLPPARNDPGAMSLVVINHAANPVQVFGQIGDGINDQAAANGVTQMQFSVVLYFCIVPGIWYTDSLAVGFRGSLQTLSTVSGITAHAGGGQASATPVNAMVDVINTVATAGDSVVLPASFVGMQIILVNSGANPMQVFGAGTDTINGQLATTGVSQMQNSVVVYTCGIAGQWVAQGIGSGFSGSFNTASSVDGLVAHAGGGQALGTPLTAQQNFFGTVATAGDSALLPSAKVGMNITVINKTATSMNVFPASGETINGQAANASVAVAGSTILLFFCGTAGQWWTK